LFSFYSFSFSLLVVPSYSVTLALYPDTDHCTIIQFPLPVLLLLFHSSSWSSRVLSFHPWLCWPLGVMPFFFFFPSGRPFTLRIVCMGWTAFPSVTLPFVLRFFFFAVLACCDAPFPFGEIDRFPAGAFCVNLNRWFSFEFYLLRSCPPFTSEV